jgi:membrane fusion protein (multidrug efflux system)
LRKTISFEIKKYKLMKRIIILPILSVCILFAACKDDKNNEKPKAERSFPVLQLTERDTVLHIPYVADIQANKNVEVHSRTEGILEKIYITEGQHVKKGQLLFKINDSELQIELSKATASYNSAAADAKVAAVEVDRVQTLVDKKIITQTELDLAKAKYKAALARADVALAEKDAVAKRISYTSIHSPFTGVVDRIPFKEGSLVTPNALLTTLSDIHSVYAYFNISENEYLQLAENEANDFQLDDIKLMLPNGTTYPYSGKLSSAESEIDENTGNIAYKVKFDNPDGILRHGASGKILITRTIPKAVMIPQKAVFEIQDKNFVFVLGKDSVVSQKGIEVLQRLADSYVVGQGLSPSDKVVLEGIQSLREGQKIVPRNL